MTIETSTKPVTTKASDTTDSRGRKAAGQAGSGPANGFLAILAAMDASGGATMTLADQEDTVEASATMGCMQAVAGIPTALNPNPAPTVPTADFDPALQGQLAMLGSSLAADRAQGGTTPLRGETAPGKPANGNPGFAISALHDGAKPENSQPTDLLQGQATSRSSGKPDSKAKTNPAADAGAGHGVAEPSRIQEMRFMATLDVLRGGQEGVAAEAPAVASSLVTQVGEKPTTDRGRFSERVAEPGFSAPSVPLGTTSYASTAVQDMGAVSAEMYVAQEISYWISQDVKSAELKLDGLGLEAVEVSISMHGNEAQVAFRTDELQARTLLEGAAAHLKEALLGEGLVLSGVSVGTSRGRDTGDTGDNGGRQRQGSRQTASIPVSRDRSDAGVARSGAAGGTLDLYV